MSDLREFQTLHGVNEACRGAGFMCQLGHAEFRRPLGILRKITNLFGKFYKGWPCLIRNKEDLLSRGPLSNHCQCVPPHHHLKGVDVLYALLPALWARGFGVVFLRNFIHTTTVVLERWQHDNIDDLFLRLLLACPHRWLHLWRRVPIL